MRNGMFALLGLVGCQQGVSTNDPPTQPPAAVVQHARSEPVMFGAGAEKAKRAADYKAAADAAARKLEASPPAQKDDRPPPPEKAGLVWHEGVGVPPCVRGGSLARCEQVFGRGERDKDHPDSVAWPTKSIEVTVARGRIDSLWVHFGNDGFSTFAGTGDHWIDAKATVEDILRWYGPPETAFDFSDEAGVRETSLLYYKRGLYFDFKQGVIEQIAIIEPSQVGK